MALSVSTVSGPRFFSAFSRTCSIACLWRRMESKMGITLESTTGISSPRNAVVSSSNV
ncbi:hypothetical protein D3C83_298270 [compost metagenome]